ncbi:unnamed protein product [Gadus morhua 'NCC']
MWDWSHIWGRRERRVCVCSVQVLTAPRLHDHSLWTHQRSTKPTVAPSEEPSHERDSDMRETLAERSGLETVSEVIIHDEVMKHKGPVNAVDPCSTPPY